MQKLNTLGSAHRPLAALQPATLRIDQAVAVVRAVQAGYDVAGRDWPVAWIL